VITPAVTSGSCPQRLVILTRYPTPGTTKTRLIPALGPEGAAELQRRMTEHTVAQARRLGAAVEVEVRYTGATAAAMEQWLGGGFPGGAAVGLWPQGEGDLGDRMGRAVRAALGAGIERVVLIGIDCPDLETTILAQAFAALQTVDVVLGPAIDGGYYLIGLRRWVPDLFEAIPWGSDRVLALTLDRAQACAATVQQLVPLPDLDRPEDLPLWDQNPRLSLIPVSVIIPTLNEAQHLGATLRSLRAAANCLPLEVIVVDGGSGDETRSIAEQAGARVIQTEPGRANQLNQGAEQARGEILLFLHGDTQVPPDWIEHMIQTLAQPGVIAGAFRLRIQGQGWGLRGVEWGTNVRSRYGQLPYGDQGLFLHRATFAAIGPFADLPIMEDFELVQRLKGRGRIALAPAAVQTSDRRWRKLGIVRTTVINQLMLLGYALGVAPDRLAQFYRRQRPVPPPSLNQPD